MTLAPDSPLILDELAEITSSDRYRTALDTIQDALGKLSELEREMVLDELH